MGRNVRVAADSENVPSGNLSGLIGRTRLWELIRMFELDVREDEGRKAVILLTFIRDNAEN